MFGFERDVRKAEQTINKLIEMAKEYNGAVYLVDKENPDFCTKLDRPVRAYLLVSDDKKG